MFQIQNPKTSNDGNSEKKSITAYSLEKEFEDKNWLNFKCNTGDKDSLEQVAENNLNELGYAKEFVTFYNKNKHDLSFIHLLLEKLPGWSVDDDDIDPVLWTRKLPAITQDNTNLYALCCSYIAPRMEILFLFDTIHRKIKAIAKENLNDKKYESTVFISYRNLAQSIDIDVDEDSIFTRFNVRGDDDLNVINCNYGDYYVMNLDYFLCSPYISDELLIKVKKWIKYRDDNRDKYIEVAKNVADASQKVNDIIYRNPADDLDIKQWDDMNEDGLNESLKYYNSLLTSLQVSVDPNWDASNNDFSTYKPWTKADGSVDHDKYLEKLKAQENGYGGYYTYYDILHYIIPNIEIAIRNLKKVDEKKEDYIKDWETNWDLYGTSELDALNKKYTEELEKVQDYAKPWSELTDEEKRANSGNKDSYNIYHNKYVEIYGYISANGTLTAAIAKRNQEKKEAQKILDGYNSQMSSMKISASINNADYGFTDEDKTVIYSLFHDQDYQNNNIVSTSVDTSVTEIDREKELYDDAVEKLSEVAQPQFKFTVSLDNLYRIEAFKHWQGELELLKFIRLGIRDDYSVKLRVTGITWNPCDVTEDLTLEFSNMITSRSGRTDLTELLDTENNRGSKNSISFGTGNSDSEKEYLSSMLQQLVKMGAFKTAVGNIAGSTTANLDEARINTLVSNFINASKIKVDNIEGDKGSFNEFFTKYLDSEVSAYSVTAANIVSKLGTTAVNRATADSDGNAINSTYLKRSGGAMTGNISYQGTKATIEVIRFIDNKNDVYGNGIAIGAGGATIIGGGESSAFCQNSYIATGGDEKLILANDGAIDFYTNCQNNSTTDAVHVQIDATGKFTGVSAQATKLQTTRYIFGKTFDGTYDVAGQATVYGSYSATADIRYGRSGLQIRENDCVQAKQSDIAYAPSIGFHWAGRIAATLLFHSDGNFYFRKQNFTDRATIDANLYASNVSTSTLGVSGTATFSSMSVHNGGVKSGLLHLQGTTSASIAYGANNPKIKFVNSDGSQIVELMYTDYDSVRWPAGLAVRGNQGNEYLDVPHLYANQVHVDNHCALQYDNSNQCLNFVFS